MSQVESAAQESPQLSPFFSAFAKHASSPRPAYTLSGLLLASVPVSFWESARSINNRKNTLGARKPFDQLVNPSAASSSSSSSLSASKRPPSAAAPSPPNVEPARAAGQKAVRTAIQRPLGLPNPVQLLCLGSLVGLGGYIIDTGDVLNGSGVVAGWSFIYVLVNSADSVRSLVAKKPLPMALTVSAALLGVGIHGSYQLDKTAWTEAIPGIMPQRNYNTHIPGLPQPKSPANPTPQSQLNLPVPSQASAGPLALLFAASSLFAFRGPRKGAASAWSSMSKRYSSSQTLSKSERFATSVQAHTIPRGFAVAHGYAGIKAAISPKPVPDAAAPPSGSSAPKADPKPDLALIVSTTDKPAAAAGTFTRNVFKAAPVVLSSQILVTGSKSSDGARARSILVNSGCANAVTGTRGLQDAQRCGQEVGKLLSCGEKETLLLSTGVIGVPLPMKAIESKLPELARTIQFKSNAEESDSSDAWRQIARAFMTTDTFPKLRTRTFKLAGQEYRLLGIDKGAGMIHPGMSGPSSTTGGLHATLLGLFVTDAKIAPSALQVALDYAVSYSFNCISVDGDMSTNDTIIALANGAAAKADTAEMTESSSEFPAFKEELRAICTELAQLVVRDGEGAEKFVQITVKNAPTREHAHAIASSISTSPLVKCALHGGDANWGRILCAVGYAPLPPSTLASGVDWSIDPSKVTVRFLRPANAPNPSSYESLITVLENGAPKAVDETKAATLLSLEDIVIEVDLAGGMWNGDAKGGEAKEEATYWTCDFSKEYVAINGDYRS